MFAKLKTMEKLNAQIAQQMVRAIDYAQADYEMAHSLEDRLRKDFIEGLARGLYTEHEAIEIAQIVISTDEMDFPRHCA